MKNKKGFTLVELLVVIAIIGILSSVAVVNLNGARDKAKRAAALATVSQLSTAFVLCQDAGNHINGPAAATTGGGSVCADVTQINTNWPDLTSTGYVYNSDDVANNINGASNSGWGFVVLNGASTDINCTQSGCN